MNAHNHFPYHSETGPPAECTLPPDAAPATPDTTPAPEEPQLTPEDHELISAYFDYPEAIPQILSGECVDRIHLERELANLAREAPTDADARKLLNRLAQLGIADADKYLNNKT